MQNTNLETLSVDTLADVTGGLGGFLGMLSGALGGGGKGGGQPPAGGPGPYNPNGPDISGGGGGDITRGLVSSFGLGRAFGM